MLTTVARLLAKGDLHDTTITLISSAKTVPIQPRPAEVCSITIGMALSRMLTEILLSLALVDSRDYLASPQVPNCTPSGKLQDVRGGRERGDCP